MFINREKERKSISDFLCNQTPTNKVLFITGHSGVGKSALVRYLAKHKLRRQNLIVIKVHVSKSSPETIENNHYFNALYSAVAEYSEKKVFDKFISPAQHGSKNIKNWLKIVTATALNKAGVPESSKVYEPSMSPTLIRKRDYIIDVIKKGGIVINIENIQNIDTSSFEMIIDLLRRLKSLLFILEYTIEDDNQGKLLDMMNELNGIAQCQIEKIKQLNFNEAIALAPSDQRFDLSALRKEYEINKGNLMLIIMAQENIDDDNDSIEISFKLLSKHEQFILYLLYWNDGEISLDMLHSILFDREYQQYQALTIPTYEKSISVLLNEKFIDLGQQMIKIHHDSIILEISKHSINAIIVTAYRLIKEYYLNQRDKQDSSYNEYIEKLFILYVKSGDEDMSEIVEPLKQIILKCKYPKAMLSKIAFFQNKILSDSQKNLLSIAKVIETFAEISYYLNDYEESKRALDCIYNESNAKHRILRVALLAVKHTEDANNLVHKLIDHEASKSRIKLTMELYVLIEKMRTAKKEESLEYAKSLVESYKNCPALEYGYLLRCYAELLSDIDLSYKIYEFCIEHFRKYDRVDLQAEIHISIAMIDSYLGKLSSAKEHITLASTIAPNHIKENYFLNNIAVIQMLNEDFTENIERNLSDALLLDGDEYTRIISMCNLLVYFCKADKIKQASEMAKSIEQSSYSFYKYDELQIIVYLNLSYYYSHIDTKKQFHYMEKLKEISGSEQKSSYMPSEYYEQFPYRIDFLGYWEFEISNDL